VPTVPEIIRRAGRAYPGRVAIVDGGRRSTFAETDERSIRLGHALRGLAGEGSGEVDGAGRRVAILMKNRLEYIEADLAIARAGLVKVPINPRLSDDERRYLVEDSGAAVIITEADELDRVMEIGGPARAVLSVGGGAGTVDYEDAVRQASSHETPIEPDPDRLSLLLYTSGTTGRPKGAMLLDRCRVAGSTMMLAEEYPVGPDDGMVHAGPLSHGSGSKVITFYARGARNIVMPRFDPREFVRRVREDGGTTTFVVPTMIQMLLEEAGAARGAEPRGLRGLRNITYGGAAISRETLTKALDAFGPILTQIYGSSEAPHPVTVLRHRDEDDPHLSGHEIVPAGRPVIGVDVQLADGELWVRGPNVMSGYWNKPEATAEAMSDGWYRTGDVARWTDDGMLTIVDRSKDLIITGGLNVYPAEVERVLRDLPGVQDVAVVGLPDPRWGEIVAAAMVLLPVGSGSRVAQDARSVQAWCDTRLANYKRPRRIIFADALPKGSTGKVIKRGVRDLFDDSARRRSPIEG
jgi:fatty-acyl-CoA synthase